jgi:tetratricopeptide (TPR) repeat protein
MSAAAIRVMRPLAIAALVGLLAMGRAATADQTDSRLEGLFTELRTAESADAAAPVEAQIWQIWMQSGDEHVDNLMAVGVDAMNGDDLDGAFEAFSRVVAMAPKFAEGWNKRATVLFLMGRTAESISDIDHVLVLEPRHFGALSGLGLCNARLQKDKAALEAFQRAAAVDPQSEGIRRNIEETRRRLERHSI